jgi:hypothetical protein
MARQNNIRVNVLRNDFLFDDDHLEPELLGNYSAFDDRLGEKWWTRQGSNLRPVD